MSDLPIKATEITALDRKVNGVATGMATSRGKKSGTKKEVDSLLTDDHLHTNE